MEEIEAILSETELDALLAFTDFNFPLSSFNNSCDFALSQLTSTTATSSHGLSNSATNSAAGGSAAVAKASKPGACKMDKTSPLAASTSSPGGSSSTSGTNETLPLPQQRTFSWSDSNQQVLYCLV